MQQGARHFLVINPNTTASMTRKIGEAARAVAGPETRITAINPTHGPAAIQGAADGDAALPGLLALVDATLADAPGIDAVIIACFDDTGVWQLKSRCSVPVIGIGEAACHMASLLVERFSIVTTLSVSIPVLEDNLARNGLARRCAKVRASDVPVLDLEDAGSDARSKVTAEMSSALAADDIGAIVLGCAGMADLANELSEQFQVPVIDGVAAAIGIAEALPLTARLGRCSALR
ncbi:aspartate/glutamate racemase family protein [uncultured Roseibium sp.]|uniref:aspartate/glutamate racemase family protein n=1 Tax=uncultured Roseibium sp. TaxID=1936171 RepID=UPI002599F278|nr:aspartate/glutamate racemase family protein [uncultured Roseibium sp.]